MISGIKNFAKSKFIRNVAVVATGTAAAQAISMAFAPIITRLYGPEAYGLMGIFTSVVGVLSTVAALGYPTAIVLQKSEADARRMANLSLCIGVGMALLTTIALAYFGKRFLNLLNAEVISAYIYLIPLAMLFSVITAVLGQWLIRENAFKLIARYRVLTAFLLSLVKSGFGFFYPTAMILIATNIIGGLLGTVLTFIGWTRLSKEQRPEKPHDSIQSKSMRQLASQYRDFPLLRTPQNLINALSQSLPVLLLSIYFGAGSAGQYSIAIIVLGVPASLVGGSVMSVFYPRITEAIHKGEDARALIIKATVGMALIGAIPYLIIIFMGPLIFSFVFGEEWRTAGEYARWLSAWLFLQYVNKPAVSAIPALRLQGGLLVYELFSTGTKVLALFLGFVFFEDDVSAVALFSMFGVVAYLWLIFWVIKHSHSSAKYKTMDME